MQPKKVTRMKVLRERAGVSQHELAQMLAVSQPLVSTWERGLTPIPAPRATQIAEALGVGEAGLSADVGDPEQLPLGLPLDDEGRT